MLVIVEVEFALDKSAETQKTVKGHAKIMNGKQIK